MDDPRPGNSINASHCAGRKNRWMIPCVRSKPLTRRRATTSARPRTTTSVPTPAPAPARLHCPRRGRMGLVQPVDHLIITNSKGMVPTHPCFPPLHPFFPPRTRRVPCRAATPRTSGPRRTQLPLSVAGWCDATPKYPDPDPTHRVRRARAQLTPHPAPHAHCSCGGRTRGAHGRARDDRPRGESVPCIHQ